MPGFERGGTALHAVRPRAGIRLGGRLTNRARWDAEQRVCSHVGPGRAGTRGDLRRRRGGSLGPRHALVRGRCLLRGHRGAGGTLRSGRCSSFMPCLFVFFLGVGPSALNNLNVSGRSGGGFQYVRSVSAMWLSTGLVFDVLQRQENGVWLAGMGRCPDPRRGRRILGEMIFNFLLFFGFASWRG